MASPTQRTLNEARKLGYIAAVVEKWIPQTRQRKDLFGFVDVLCLRGPNTLAIQATSGSNHSARVAKIKASENLPAMLAAGWVVEVWSWKKTGPRGAVKRWTCRKEAIVMGAA